MTDRLFTTSRRDALLLIQRQTPFPFVGLQYMIQAIVHVTASKRLRFTSFEGPILQEADLANRNIFGGIA